MESDIISYLSQYITLSDKDKQAILELNLLQTFSRDTILLNEGETARHCYLVLKGCVRSYYLIDGEEKTTELYTENQPVTPVSYIKQTPSEYYVSCVEDCILSVGTPEKTSQLLDKIPKFASLIATVSNKLRAEHQVEFDDFRNLSPEGRYMKLLDVRPHLMNRVPQYIIASYLGIKPQSLSRIRKRITEARRY